MRLWLLLLSAPLAAAPADGLLSRIEQRLAPLRANQETGNESPSLVLVKHDLLRWAEARLALQAAPDVAPLNADLARAGLFCDEKGGPRECPYWSYRGYLAPLRLERPHPEVIVLITGVGLRQCGFDESAYAYRQSSGRWRRFWESERNHYPAQEPPGDQQRLEAVKVSPDLRYILTLGTRPWCTSAWHPMWARLWSVSAPRQPVWAKEVSANIDEPPRAELTTDSFWIEYRTWGFDTMMSTTRTEIERYRLAGSSLQRIEPVALNPMDFVAAWKFGNWETFRQWTAPEIHSEAEVWRRENANLDRVAWDYPNHEAACAGGDVQLATREPRRFYFRVRTLEPRHFRLVGLGSQPWADCPIP